MNIHANLNPGRVNAFSGIRYLRLFLVLFCAVSLLAGQVVADTINNLEEEDSIVVNNNEEEEEPTQTNVAITCDDGDQCTVTFESGSKLEVNFKNTQASCQAAFDGLTGSIVWPEGVVANYSLTCPGGGSGSSGSGSGGGSQSASGQSRRAVSPPEHNCCFVDRQCTTENEWNAGYYAYQNGQCAATSQSQTQTSSPASTAASSPVDNCCGIDRQCTTNEDWVDGYYAYQNGQCATQT